MAARPEGATCVQLLLLCYCCAAYLLARKAALLTNASLLLDDDIFFANIHTCVILEHCVVSFFFFHIGLNQENPGSAGKC